MNKIYTFLWSFLVIKLLKESLVRIFFVMEVPSIFIYIAHASHYFLSCSLPIVFTCRLFLYYTIEKGSVINPKGSRYQLDTVEEFNRSA